MKTDRYVYDSLPFEVARPVGVASVDGDSNSNSKSTWLRTCEGACEEVERGR